MWEFKFLYTTDHRSWQVLSTICWKKTQHNYYNSVQVNEKAICLHFIASQATFGALIDPYLIVNRVHKWMENVFMRKQNPNEQTNNYESRTNYGLFAKVNNDGNKTGAYNNNDCNRMPANVLYVDAA